MFDSDIGPLDLILVPGKTPLLIVGDIMTCDTKPERDASKIPRVCYTSEPSTGPALAELSPQKLSCLEQSAQET